MLINELLKSENMSKYRLSKESGIPMTTISDICSGKANIEKCSAGTLFRIAQVLGITVDSIIDDAHANLTDYRCSFETFKSNTCHQVKDMGDMDFIIEILEKDKIRELYNKKWYRESFYLLAMIDYLSRENGLPICTNYNDIRNHKLDNIIYPSGVIISYAATLDDNIKKEAVNNSIPEFIKFNIVENEVRNVF